MWNDSEDHSRAVRDERHRNSALRKLK